MIQVAATVRTAKPLEISDVQAIERALADYGAQDPRAIRLGGGEPRKWKLQFGFRGDRLVCALETVDDFLPEVLADACSGFALLALEGRHE